MKATTARDRFKITTFANRGGSTSYRVTGSRRNGERVRENYLDEQDAANRRLALEVEYRAAPSETALRSTRLSESQIAIAETVFNLIDETKLLRAVEYFKKYGEQSDVAESPTADEAFDAFKKWLNGEPDASGNNICKMRTISRNSFRTRIEPFINSLGLIRIADVSPEMVEKFLGRMNVSALTKTNYKRAVQRFFSWCIQRPRQWRKDNPCALVKIDQDEAGEPEILTVSQCEKLLRSAEANQLALYAAVSLFAGLRPFEARRLTWDKVNLVDREIRITGDTCKTGKGRVVSICDTLLTWLKAYKGQPFYPATFQVKFLKAKRAAGMKKRVNDVLRHTAISHFFRKSSSYGLAAERFGNSEQIIKRHYQGRVSTSETEQFYGIMPSEKTP